MKTRGNKVQVNFDNNSDNNSDDIITARALNDEMKEVFIIDGLL